MRRSVVAVLLISILAAGIGAAGMRLACHKLSYSEFSTMIKDRKTVGSIKFVKYYPILDSKGRRLVFTMVGFTDGTTRPMLVPREREDIFMKELNDSNTPLYPASPEESLPFCLWTE